MQRALCSWTLLPALGLFVLSSLALPVERAEAHRNSPRDEFVTEPLTGLSADQLATL